MAWRGIATAGIALAAAGALTPLSAFSQTTNWTGATSTDWFTGTNWSAGVPTATQETIINTQNPNGTVIAAPGAVAEELFISNGTDAVLTVTGAGTITAVHIGLSDDPAGFGTLNVVDGGTATATTALNVGQLGDGELNILTGGAASGAQVGIGDEVGTTGTINVDGTGSEIRETDPNDNFLFSVGYEGNGFLNVTNGGRAVSEGQTVVGTLGTSNGTIIVDGDGSLLRTEQGITVGNVGTGTVIVRNQGLFQSAFAILGAFDNPTGFPGIGDGTIEITGAGTQWLNATTGNSATLLIGNQGPGRVRVLDGATLQNFGEVQFGREAGVLGTMTIDGTDSFAGFSRTTLVGMAGEGRIHVTNGGRLATGRVGETSGRSVRVGDEAGSSGLVRIDGEDSFWGSVLPIAVGRFGAGSLEIVNGGVLDFANSLNIGVEIGSSGTVLLSGEGSAIEEIEDVAILHRIGGRGTGLFTIADGASATFLNDLFLGNGETSNATLVVTGAGSTLIGDGLVFHQGTTRVEIRAGATLDLSDSIGLGLSGPGNQTMIVTGPGTTATAGYLVAIGREAGTSVFEITDGATFSTASFIFMGSDPDNVATLLIDGADTRASVEEGITIGNEGDSTVTISNGARYTGHRTRLGGDAGASGTLNLVGSGSRLDDSGNIFSNDTDGTRIGEGGTGVFNLSNGAVYSHTGTGGVTIALEDGSSGALNIGGPDAPQAPGEFLTSRVLFGAGDGAINFNHTASNFVFAPGLEGDGRLNFVAGTTRLTGDGAGFTGIASVDGGNLVVIGTLGGTTNVLNGLLGGTGTLGAVNVADGGILAPGTSPGTITMDSLVLNNGSILDFELDTPGVVGMGINDLIVVTGGLTLDGTVNVTDLPGFGNGLYTLIQYGALNSDNGLNLGTTPAGFSYALGSGTGSNSAVTLTVSGGAAGSNQFWDGSGPFGDGTVDGGSGTWNAGGTNWTDAAGDANAVWGSQFAIFSGTAGTVTVEGAQTFTGMQFLTDGYEIVAGAGGELVTNIAATNIRIGAGLEAEIAVPITGTGGLVKQEGGILVLSGANTYDGATTVNGGTLRAGAANAFSEASAQMVNSGAALDLDGFGQTVGSLAGDGSVLLGAALLTAGGDDTSTTFGGVIGGSGGLTKTGIGELTLTGENIYAGLTTINQGTLTLGDGGAGGSVAGDIFNDNNFLVFNRSDDFSYGGEISGSGSVSFLGAGMATLTGDSSGFTGPVIVNAGNLRIGTGGALGATQLSVGDAGTLSGLGIVAGDVSVQGGMLAPGADTLGILTVQGDVSFDADSSFAVRIAGNGDNDVLAVTQEANVAGDVLVTAIDSHTSYVDGQDYTILTATGGVNGQFGGGATMLTHSAFLTPTLTYGADNVLLNIAVTADFTTVAETFNQIQAAMGLNDLEQSDDALIVFNEIAMLNADQARNAFDLSSGEIHASGQHVIDHTFGLFSRMLRGQGAAGLGGGTGGQVDTAPLGYSPTPRPTSLPAGIMAADTPDLPIDAYANNRVANAWLTPLGGRGVVEADGNAGEFDWWAAGLAGGYEGPIDVASGNAWAGFGFGYMRNQGTVDARLSTLDADSLYIGIYGGWTDGPWSLAGSLAYGASSISTERRILFGGIDRTAEADYWSHTVGFSGEAAYGFNVAPGTTLSPLATLDAGWSGHGGFAETGAGALGLTGASESWTRLNTGLGVALSHVMATETGEVTFEGRVLWEHAFADIVPSQTLAFAGSPTGFQVHGPDAGRDRLRLGAGAVFQVTEHIKVRAQYDGLFSDSQSSHGASLGFKMKF